VLGFFDSEQEGKMATRKTIALTSACPNPKLEDVYGVLLDIERRVDVLRRVIGRLDPKTELKFVKRGIGVGFKPTSKLTTQVVVCNSCLSPTWDPLLK
jgi:hypothetical protein